jgi:SAM-dependent methyltransferase
MKHVCRDMDDYVQKYLALPFEPIQIEYRRKLVLNQIRAHSPRRLLEVGCGAKPLFCDLPTEMMVTVVEPALAFVDHARRLAVERSHVQIRQGFVESVDFGDVVFDMVILSCVLHEVPDPHTMLRKIRSCCAPGAIVHVNVPNAHSLHRLWAVAMGLIPSVGHRSDTQLLMQQRETPYDTLSLKTQMTDCGFDVVDEGSFFVKPFTHDQMQKLIDAGYITPKMLDGLDKLVEFLPELGSEIWVNARSVE